MSLRDLFYLHRTDRKVMTTLLVVAVVALGALWLTDGNEEQPTVTEPSQRHTVDIRTRKAGRYGPTQRERERTLRGEATGHSERPKAERFFFDPNTADSATLIRLGLLEWQVRNIQKYRRAGGIFRTKEDFAQVYGLTLKEYDELEPYIHISPDYQQASLSVRRPSTERDSLPHQHKIGEHETVDLATADTNVLKTVPGIGDYYAREIVRRREWLGGFASIDQLDEIEGFPQQAKKYFRLDSTKVVRLNINRLPLNRLRNHPYLNYYQAKAITDYRRKNGKIESLEQLKLLPDFTPELIEKLSPYIEF